MLDDVEILCPTRANELVAGVHEPEAPARADVAVDASPRHRVSRRDFLVAGIALSAGCAIAPLTACSSRDGEKRVILYTSADGEVADPVLALFTQRTGIRVESVRDTEATKTTGLVRRIIDKAASPKAEVFWSNEAMAVARLEREGLLAPLADGSKYARLASRARVIVYDTRSVAPSRTTPTPPSGLADLLRPEFKSRIGIARPQFGTTRAHISAVRLALGEPAFREWCSRLRDHGIRQYAGNSSVVQAVANAEIAIGLTDTDDVWAGKRNGWPLEMAYPSDDAIVPRPILIPNTVALLKHASGSAPARSLLDFLRGTDVERLMVESELKHIPRDPALVARYADRLPPNAAEPDWAALDRVSDDAIGIWEAIVGV